MLGMYHGTLPTKDGLRYVIEGVIVERPSDGIRKHFLLGKLEGGTVSCFIKPDYWIPDQDRTEHIKREVNANSVLDPHENVAHAFDVIKCDGHTYVVYPLFNGTDLRKLAKGSPLTPQQTTYFFPEFCDGVSHLHTSGIIHRDLKPSNLLIVSLDGYQVSSSSLGEAPITPKVIDFGTALHENVQSLEDSRHTQGHPLIIPPDVIAGGRPNQATDTYALGVSLFYSLTGSFPFGRPEHGARLIFAAHQLCSIPSARDLNPEVGPCLDAVIKKSLAKGPRDRFQSAEEFKWEYIDAMSKDNRHN